MLSRSQRLTSAQFDRAFAHSQSVRHPLLALKARARGDDGDGVRAAFVVPKKQAKAAARNRTRRRLRERYRLHARRGELRGCDLIFLSTPATHDATNAQLDEALAEVLQRMKRKLGTPDFSEAAQTTPTNSENEQEKLNLAQSRADNSIRLSAAPQEKNEVSVFACSALAVIGFYQRFISPGLPPSCRFYPSCSRYTYGAIERFGLARGLWLGCYRVCRCHPWNAGGIDEVPDKFPAPRALAERAFAKTKAFFARRRFDSPRN